MARAQRGAPQTVEEALERLQEILGDFDPDHSQLWWNHNCRVERAPPDPAEPGMLHVMEDANTVGAPFRYGEQLGFDRISRRRAWSYEVSASGQRDLTWSQQRHSAVRYLMRRGPSGLWFIERQFLSHSNPAWIDRTYARGVVVWGDKALTVVTSGIDWYGEARGKRREAPIYAFSEFRREGDRLISQGRYQYFEFAIGPDGLPLPIPDFELELGSVIKMDAEYHLQGAGQPSLLLDEESGVVSGCLSSP